MKTKIGTVLDHDLVRRAFDQVLEEALSDHFIPWARHLDNGVENLVAADGRCNNDKRDFVASTEHLQRWRAAHFDADGK